MPTFEVRQGAAKNVYRQLTADGVTAYTAATTPYLSSDTLACQVWAGNGYATVATPAVTWFDVNTAVLSINWVASDTASLAPGEYPYFVTVSRSGSSWEVDRGTVQILPAPGSSTADDLVTPQVLGNVIDASNLTDAEQALLPMLVTAASTAVRRYCARWFTLKAWDELYTVAPPFNQIVLKQHPVQSVSRVATNPRPALTIVNTTSTNYRATVKLNTTGDALAGFSVSGVTLTRYYSGTSASNTIAFGGSVVAVSDLATAVNALGNGWNATYDTGFAGWALSDIRPVQGPLPATGQGAQLQIYADDLSFILDEQTGILDLSTPDNTGFTSPRFGPWFANDVTDATPYGGALGVRVAYTAGSATVPYDIQVLTAEVVKASVDRLRADSAIKSESDGVLSWSARPLEELAFLPPWVRQGLAPYVNHRA